MKNFKVFAEVKKICMIFFTLENICYRPITACSTRDKKLTFTLLFNYLVVLFFDG